MREIALVIALTFIASAVEAGTFPDAHEMPPAGWSGPVFKLSQDYPKAPPYAETYPWKRFDFATQPEQYIQAVYRYAIEGNVESGWDGFNNAVRKWYHAPWMHYGNNGREFIHGLTRERNSRPQELAPTQSCYWQNWAVGFYNAPGGYVIGQVWKDPENPDPSVARFPDGTVSVKLLFTAAPESQVPYLRDGFRWQANIDPLTGACASADPTGVRTPASLTLLQIDLAVRDTRADGTTGWVMGTLVYDGNSPGETPWDRMQPVGLQWGNDPTLTPDAFDQGQRVTETWSNPNLGILQHLGWLGRLNGPVDNPQSACLSCHGTAQSPVVSGMVPPGGATVPTKMRWFRNIRAGEAFDAGSPENPVSVDYSLQLAVGIQNQKRASSEIVPEVANGEVTMATIGGDTVFPVSREEGVQTASLASSEALESKALDTKEGRTRSSDKNTLVAIGVIATAAIGLFNLFYSFRNNRRSSYVNAVTSTRLEWIGEMRQNLARYVASIHQSVMAPPAKAADREKISQEIAHRRMLIRLQLAPRAPAPLDADLEKKVEFLYQNFNALSIADLEARIEELVSTGQDFLWVEWFKVKKEVIYGDPYDPLSRRWREIMEEPRP